MPSPLPEDPIAHARQNWRDHGWDAAADGMATVTSVVRVHQILMGHIDAALKPYGLSFARFEMLRLLGFTQSGRLPMHRARDLLQVHPASVTNTVDRLQADGLVRRVPNPKDGRSFLLEITDEGRALVSRATSTLNDEVFAALDLPHDEQVVLTRLLADFRQRNGDFAEPRRAPDPL